MKKSESRWYQVTRISDGDKAREVLEVDLDGNSRPVILQQQFYNKHGDKVLAIVQVDMDGMPPADAEALRKMLQAQFISPTLLVPPQVQYLELRAMSDVEVRTVEGLK